MIEIYRVENRKGAGCYRGLSDSLKWAIKKAFNDFYYDQSDEFHPIPYLDIGIDRSPKKEEICGFKDLHQAKKWFSEKELKIYRKFGFELKRICVKKITAVGYHQVLAIR